MSSPEFVSYEHWILLVDQYVQRALGVIDLPDYQYRDAYDSEVTAAEVAEDIIQRTQRGDF